MNMSTARESSPSNANNHSQPPKDVPQSTSAPPAEEEGDDSTNDQFVIVGGEKMEKMFTDKPTEQHMQDLRDMAMRSDDVIIAAYPKSGTHWLWEVVHMLLIGKVEYEPRTKEHLMLEFNEVERFDAQSSPRIINSHLLLRHLSKEIVSKKTHVIHVVRNPKDIMVSKYHHGRQLKRYKDKGFEHYIKQFLEGSYVPGSAGDYFAYLKEMERWEDEHPDLPFLTLCFEDMKQDGISALWQTIRTTPHQSGKRAIPYRCLKAYAQFPCAGEVLKSVRDPVDAVKRVAQFLGLERSDDLCADIAEACSFKKLKMADSKKESHRTDSYKTGKPQLYRKGEVGDWKNHFTVAQSELTDSVLAEKLPTCKYLDMVRYTL